MRNVSDLKKEIEEQLGTSLTTRQLWAIVKLSKHVRLRCRNNAAFNNCMNQLFPYARFQQVTKTRKNRFTGLDETYPGLSIVVNGETVEGEDED
jgi:hypothetical protein